MILLNSRFDSAYIQGENKMHVKAFESWVFCLFFFSPLACSVDKDFDFSFLLGWESGLLFFFSYFTVPEFN